MNIIRTNRKPRTKQPQRAATQLARHEIDRLCVLHLTMGLMDAAADPICDGGLPAEVKGKAAVICSQIIQLIERAAHLEPSVSDNPRLTNSIKRMEDMIGKSFADGVDVREGIAMVMARVAIEEEELNSLWNQHLNDKNLHMKTLAWSQLHDLLTALHDALGPSKAGAAESSVA